MRALVLYMFTLAAAAACWTGARTQPAATTTTRRVAPRAEWPRRSFVGVAIGQHIVHVGAPSLSRLTLPPGLAHVSTTNLGTEPGRSFVVAKRGDDLIVLMTGEDGVVIDDITFAGVASSHRVIDDCNDRAFGALVRARECRDDRSTVRATAAWNSGDAAIELVGEPTRCSCWFRALDE